MKIRNQTCAELGCQAPATRISHGILACAQHGELRDRMANLRNNPSHEHSRHSRQAHRN